MFIINKDNSIELTRGDTAYITLDIENKILNSIEEVNTNYIFQPQDIIKFSVKRNANDENYLFKKTIVIEEETEVAVIKILPEDTKKGTFGQYYYDVELTIAKTGDVNTVIPQTKFILKKEVS